MHTAADMAVTSPSSAAAAAAAAVWDSVAELTNSAQERGVDAVAWAAQLSSVLTSAGVSMPSVDAAGFLVSHICWSNNHLVAWKFLEKALTLRIVPPLVVLSLLTARVLPCRRSYPVAYRLHMELIKRYAFSLPSLINGPNYEKIKESVDEALNLSQIFGVQAGEPGALLVLFVLSLVWQLLDASLDDEGLLDLTSEKKSRWPVRAQDMEIDNHDSFEEKRTERHGAMCKVNTVMAVELVGEFFRNKLTSRMLYLASRNMPMHWECFMQHLQLLSANSSALISSKHITSEIFLQLISDTSRGSREGKSSSRQKFHSIIISASQFPAANCSAFWLPVDLFLEDIMDGLQVATISASETLASLVKALQAINRTSWHDTFLCLWIAALRLVQRERDPIEGPLPRLDTCLCLLLSITTLAILNIIEDEESSVVDEAEHSITNQKRRQQDLISSLQKLDDYESLLSPPLPVCSAANQAAAKAMMVLSGLGSGYLDGVSLNDVAINCCE